MDQATLTNADKTRTEKKRQKAQPKWNKSPQVLEMRYKHRECSRQRMYIPDPNVNRYL